MRPGEVTHALQQIDTALWLPMSCHDILINTDDDERPARIAYADCSAGDTTRCCISSSLRLPHGRRVLRDAELPLQVGHCGFERVIEFSANAAATDLQRHQHRKCGISSITRAELKTTTEFTVIFDR
jgi:hypothetical protein